MSCAGATLLLALATWHPGATDRYESITPGVSARCGINAALAAEAGAYRNSVGRASLYLGAQWQTPLPHVAVLAGVVTGYVTTPAPAAALVFDLSDRHELAVMPKAEFRGYASAWAIAWRIKLHGGAR